LHRPPPLVRRLLRSWPLLGQKAFFERELGIALKLEDETGKYFPVSDRARDVRDALVRRARDAGADLKFNTALTGLSRAGGRWRVDTSRGPMEAETVVMATGGRSVPATGSNGVGLDLLSRLGHTIHPTYPALTPLVAEPALHADLAGISLDVRVRAKSNTTQAESSGGFLFTHRGYSGPAVLDVSHVAVRSRLAGDSSATVRVRWSPLDQNQWTEVLRSHKGLWLTAVSRHLPSRLAERLLLESGIPDNGRASELKRADRTTLLERLTSYPLPWTGDEGFKKAEVTGGGLALDEIDPRTLESRRHPGLFLCGELLDAFGPIGGHNFAWAWSTGRAAGLGATRSSQVASHK
jgi:predicted Rossmann fold flavoprotein